MTTLRKTPRTARRFGRGFTLVELIVVILIIAILAALVVPNLIGRTGEAKKSKAKSDIAQLSNALNLFRTDNDRYPTAEEGLAALRNPPPDATGATRPPYITKEIPPDPWGNDYQYTPTGEYSFSILSLGSDGAPGGEGDAQDLSEGEL